MTSQEIEAEFMLNVRCPMSERLEGDELDLEKNLTFTDLDNLPSAHENVQYKSRDDSAKIL